MKRLRRGFTAIELLAACALAALLMVAVLSVLRTISVQRRQLLAQGTAQPWRQRLAEQLYFDLANARLLSWQTDSLRLEGYAGRNFGSGVPTQRPTEVLYFVRHDGNQSWLLRQETHLDSREHQRATTQMVVAGVTGFTIESIGDPLEPDRQHAVPGRLRVMLHGTDADRPLLDKSFFFSRPRATSPTARDASLGEEAAG